MTEETSLTRPSKTTEDGFKSQRDLEEEIKKLREQVAEDFGEIEELREHAEAFESKLESASQSLGELSQRVTTAETNELNLWRELDRTRQLLGAHQERARELMTEQAE